MAATRSAIRWALKAPSRKGHPIITRMAKTITTHTRAHTPQLLYRRARFHWEASLHALSGLGHKCRRSSTLATAARHTHRRGEWGPARRSCPVDCWLEPWSMLGRLGSHRSGADSARILSTQPCIHKPLSACIQACAGGKQSGDRERHGGNGCLYCAASMRRSP